MDRTVRDASHMLHLGLGETDLQDLILSQISILIAVMQAEKRLHVCHEIIEHELTQADYDILERERAFVGAIPSMKEST